MSKNHIFIIDEMDKLTKILDAYLQRGFGSMNKNDFEVWIFNQLISERLKNKSNYEISIELRIPESKVKRLQYESSLKYSSFSESELYSALNELLKKAIFKNGGQYIQFVVEDIAIRKYLDSLLKRDGRFSDSSFNSEIATIDIDDLEYILRLSKEGEKSIDEILMKAKKQLNSTDISFKSLMKVFADSMSEGAGRKTGEKVIDLSCKGILYLLTLL